MTYDIAARQIHLTHAIHAFENIQRVAKTGWLFAWQVDLRRVTCHHHARIPAKAGQHHLHLRNGGVLRFVDNNERVFERTTTHEGERCDLDFTSKAATVELFLTEQLAQ